MNIITSTTSGTIKTTDLASAITLGRNGDDWHICVVSYRETELPDGTKLVSALPEQHLNLSDIIADTAVAEVFPALHAVIVRIMSGDLKKLEPEIEVTE